MPEHEPNGINCPCCGGGTEVVDTVGELTCPDCGRALTQDDCFEEEAKFERWSRRYRCPQCGREITTTELRTSRLPQNAEAELGRALHLLAMVIEAPEFFQDPEFFHLGEKTGVDPIETMIVLLCLAQDICREFGRPAQETLVSIIGAISDWYPCLRLCDCRPFPEDLKAELEELRNRTADSYADDWRRLSNEWLADAELVMGQDDEERPETPRRSSQKRSFEPSKPSTKKRRTKAEREAAVASVIEENRHRECTEAPITLEEISKTLGYRSHSPIAGSEAWKQLAAERERRKNGRCGQQITPQDIVEAQEALEQLIESRANSAEFRRFADTDAGVEAIRQMIESDSTGEAERNLRHHLSGD